MPRGPRKRKGSQGSRNSAAFPEAVSPATGASHRAASRQQKKSQEKKLTNDITALKSKKSRSRRANDEVDTKVPGAANSIVSTAPVQKESQVKAPLERKVYRTRARVKAARDAEALIFNETIDLSKTDDVGQEGKHVLISETGIQLEGNDLGARNGAMVVTSRGLILPSAASTVQPAHSNVASSQQPDQTDSSEVPPPHISAQLGNKASVNKILPNRGFKRIDMESIAALRSCDSQNIPTNATSNILTQGPFRFVPVPSPAVTCEELAPPPKRARIARARVPAPLSREALRVTDRFSGPLHADTDEGHYVFSIGDNLTPRFKIMRKFGEGTFGRVMECWDRRRSGYVAIKVIRAVDKYRDAAMVELQVLATLAANDPSCQYPIVRLLEWFDYRGHICMVFDRLGPSIYDCLRRNGYRPFPIEMARSFMYQVLQAVAYMHSFSLVHTDLKPENILLLNDETDMFPRAAGSKLAYSLPSESAIRLIDFGSATFDEDYHSSIVSTRHYRAPEIILGLGWSKPCDMWSLGCILVELLTGDALFQTHENLEHLAMMEAVIGPIPLSMSSAAIRNGPSTVRYLFKRGSKINWPEGAENKRSLRAVDKIKPLRDHLRTHGDANLLPHINEVVDLCSKLIEWDPKKRLTSEKALKHPFFNNVELPTRINPV